MEEKNFKIILVAVVVLVVIAIAGYVVASGMFTSETRQTTQFSNDFMEGAFTGNVKLANNTSAYMQSWKDSEHHIDYNISTVDNSSALMEIYKLQGVKGPEKRSFNGNDWNIYFTQAVPANNSTDAGKTMNIIICESQGEKQGYMIYMIFSNESDVNFTLNTFCDAYKIYTEPLLQTIKLKESNDVPHIFDEFGLSEEDFNQQMDLIHQYNAGNRSALEGAS